MCLKSSEVYQKAHSHWHDSFRSHCAENPFQIVRQVYAPWFLSCHNKDLEWLTLKSPWHVTALRSWLDCVIALREISVTAQSYSSILFRRWQENPSSRREGMLIQRQEEKSAPVCGREREGELALALLFIWFPSPTPGPVLCKLG